MPYIQWPFHHIDRAVAHHHILCCEEHDAVQPLSAAPRNAVNSEGEADAGQATTRSALRASQESGFAHFAQVVRHLA